MVSSVWSYVVRCVRLVTAQFSLITMGLGLLR